MTPSDAGAQATPHSAGAGQSDTPVQISLKFLSDLDFSGCNSETNMIECDSELLKRYADEKSEAAFAELVRRHLDLVYSTANRLLRGDTHLAKDVSQQVFTALARKAKSLSHYSQVAGWLYTSTRFAACEAIRTEQRRRGRELKAGNMYELPFDSNEEIEWTQLRPVLDELLQQLNDADRTALILRFFERQSLTQVGQALELSEDAAGKRVGRALERLRDLLGKRGILSSGAVLAACLTANAVTAAPAGLAGVISSGAIAAASAVGFWSGSTLIKIKALLAAAILTGTAIELGSQYAVNKNLEQQVDELRAAQTAASPARINSASSNPSQPGIPSSADGVTALQAEVEVLKAKLRERSQRSATGLPWEVSNLVPLTDCTNAGNKTPGAAFETICWAKERIDVSVLTGVIDFDAASLTEAEKIFAALSPAAKAKFPDATNTKQMLALAWAVGTEQFVAMQVVGVTLPTADEVVLQAQWQDPTGQINGRDMRFRRESMGWKWIVSSDHAAEIIKGIETAMGGNLSR